MLIEIYVDILTRRFNKIVFSFSEILKKNFFF